MRFVALTFPVLFAFAALASDHDAATKAFLVGVIAVVSMLWWWENHRMADRRIEREHLGVQ